MVIPKPMLDELGLASGAKLDLTIENGKFVAQPVKRKVREGWEESAKLLGQQGLTDEEREWLEMPSDFDEHWEW